MRRALALPLALALSLAAAPTAHAAATGVCAAATMTITIDGGTPPATTTISVAGNVVTINGVAQAACAGLANIVITGDGVGNVVTYAGIVTGTVTANLAGGADDFTTTGAQAVILNGGAGDDVLRGAAGVDTLSGDADNDTLQGGAGADVINGGTESDTASYAERATDITVSVTTGGEDTFTSIENLTGGGGNDTLIGDPLANDLDGGAGDDLLRPGAGAGVNTGGANGAIGDTASYVDVAVAVVADIRTGVAPGSATGTGVAQDLTQIENLTGGGGADTLIGSDGDNRFAGGAASDTVSYADRVAGENIVASLTAGTGGQTGTGEADVYAADVENLTGGAGGDTLTGDAVANVLDGAGGTDTVTYADKGAGQPVTVTLDGAANDGETGGAEGDNVIAENVTGGAGGDTLTGDAVANVLDGAGGTDTVTYADKGAGQPVTVSLDGLANDGETGGAEGDNVIAENVTGGAGGDTLTGDAVANVLDGAGGTDTVTYADKVAGQPVTVTLDGAANDGETAGAEGDNAIAENLTGGDGADTLTGDANPNVLRGALGTDTVNGGAGADTIVGEADTGDTLDGGPDVDLLTYENATQEIVVNLSGVPLTPAATDAASNFENVTGGALGDTITGNAQPNVLIGGPGVDTVTYGDRAAGVTVTLDGAANDGAPGENDNVLAENVVGGGGPDTLTGDTGANLLDGAGGVDTVRYDDKAAGQAVTVRLDGLANDGETSGAEGDNAIAENLTGGADGDTLTGNGQANVLDGAGGTDTVTYADKGPLQPVTVTLDGVANDGETGGAEGDSVLAENVTGGAGPDTLTGDPAPNVLRGAGGLDTVTYLDRPAPVSVTITLDGAANDGAPGENDTIGADVENAIGGGGADTLVGSTDPNILDGSAGADTLRGGAGTDSLRGGDGADTLFGEADAGDSIDGGADGARDVLTYDGASAVVVNLSRSPAAPTGTDDVTNVEDVIGGNGDDVITGNTLANALSGGPGTDTVTYLDRASQPVDVSLDGIANDGAAGEGDNVASTENITGGGGGDRLAGNQAGNVLRGLEGNDVLIGGGGNDALDGGAGGFDTASYEDRRAPEGVSVTLNATGGGNGETDTLADFERLLGGAGDDQLTGGPGNDVIAGALGADIVAGGDGNDALEGDDGPDSLFGGAGSDELGGGDGNDRLDGGADADGFSAGRGDDDVNAFDGTSENIVCGDGNDRVDHDLADTFSAGDCEQRTLLGFLPPAFVLDPRQRDRDRDGVFAGTDCNDFDASIHPGAPDIPGDAIDQDCNTTDAPFPALTTEFRWAFAKAPLGTRVKLLALRKVPAGAKIEVKCRSARSPRCVFKTRTRTVSRRSTSVSVRGYFGDRPLSRGATIEVRVSAPRTIGRFISFTMRRDRNSPAPRRGCLAPNTTDVIACP